MSIPLLALSLAMSQVTTSEPALTPFPGQVLVQSEHSVQFEWFPEAFALGQGSARIQLSEVVLPGNHSITLSLSQQPSPLTANAVHLNGQAAELSFADDLSIWSGTVVGNSPSEAFLVFSAYGSWGWIDLQGERYHLLTDVLSNFTDSRWVTQQQLEQERGKPTQQCGVEELVSKPSSTPLLRNDVGTAAPRGARPVLATRLAFETDWHYFQLFQDANAAAVYATALVGAANLRYREQVDVVFSLDYLGIHTTSNDPWIQPDIGGTCFDVIDEFFDAWSGGGAPVAADLHHFFTAANTLCGVAITTVCDADAGFSMTGKIDGQSPFPAEPGPLNWDFVWFCHETGHNFGTPHTHEYCPPLDECAVAGFWGPCQDEVACITNGTFMSYCHGCPGGMANFTTFFHPLVTEVMRATAEAGCLALYEGVLTTDLGFALAGSQGTPSLTFSMDADADMMGIHIDTAPVSSPAFFITDTTTSFLPFLGGTLVPGFSPPISVPTDANGELDAFLNVSDSFPGGIILYTQVWFVDPSGPNGFAATNGVEWELISP